MKVVVIFDQGLSGLGGKGNLDLPLTIQKGSVGTGLVLSQHFSSIGAEIVATLSCGINTFTASEDEVVMKLAAMVKKINPDFVLAGPSFNFPEYSKMCAKVVHVLKEKEIVPACAMMAIENETVIQEYKDKIDILKMPKKGGTGLNDSFKHLCQYMELATDKTKLDLIKKEICY